MIKEFLLVIYMMVFFTGCGSTTYFINTNPTNSEVIVNNKKELLSPAKVEVAFSDTVKNYKIFVKKKGYKSNFIYITEASAEMDKKNNNLTKKINLQPISCQTIISSSAKNADLYIDKKLIGKTPQRFDFMYGKKLDYQIALKKAGYLALADEKKYDALCKENENYKMISVFNKYNIISYPKGVEVYLDNTKLGKTPLETNVEFGEHGIKRVLKFKKHGYKATTQELKYDDKISNILVKMEEVKYKDLAYIVPEISMDEHKVQFKVDYEKGYRDTIDNSPNALHVKRILTMDNINFLIGDLDSQDGSIVYSVIYPKDKINADSYIENIIQIKQMITGLDKALKNPKVALEVFLNLNNTIDSKAISSLNQDLFIFYTNVYNAIEKEQSLKNYSKQIGDLRFSYEKLLNTFLTLGVSDFYSDIWLSDNKKGFKRTKITDSDKRWVDKSPSLDQDYIYFASNRNSKDFEIWRVSAKGGSGMTKITNSPYSQDLDPSAEIGGELISYTTIPMDSINQQVWSINKKGYLPSQLKSGYQTSMANSKIAFVRKSKFTNNNQIWIMNSDGSGETVLSDERYNCFDPSLSDDGQYIVFTSDQSGNKDIWVMNSDGSGITQLTTNPSADIKPTFDDENHVVFISNRGMMWGIWSLVPKLD